MASEPGDHRDWITQVVREALSSGSSSDLLKALVEAFPASWFFTRKDATFAYVNQRACDTLGYTREELMGLTLYDVDTGLTPEIWNALLDMGPFVPAAVRTSHRRKDGSVFPVEACGSRIILNDENVAVSYVIDVSEEAQARQALAEKEHLLRSLLTEAPIVVWVVDAEQRFQLAEGSGLTLFGVEPAEAVGKQVPDLYSEVPELVLGTQRALAGKPVDGTVAVGTSYFAYRYVPRRNDAGEVVGATGVAMDVTARRSVEQANQRLLAAIEQSAEFVVLMGASGHVEYVNPAFEAAIGCGREAAVGRRWTELVPTDDAEAAAELAQALATGSGWHGMIHGSRPYARAFAEQVTLSPLRGAAGELTGFVAVGRDVTEQLRTQERLRQSQKMDAVGQLAGGVAHDFNNLLQIITGNTQLCLAQAPPSGIRAMLGEIEQACERAASLVNQLLTFSRDHAVRTRNVAVDELVPRLLTMVRRILGEHILVEFATKDGRLPVWGDESQLEQIFVNLCVNARDAMPEGGRLRVALSRQELTEQRAIALGLPGPGAYVVLEVADTGCGMTADVQARVFEPFFTTKEPGAGTGLGLSTVYAIAKRHQGGVEVRSKPGRGSVFRVYLQLSSEPDADVPRPSQRMHAAGHAALVLVAEDDASVRRITRAFLEQAGHCVITARDGLEAIALIESGDAVYDLVVVDAIMPRASGPEVYRRLRALSSAPVLFVTGFEFNALDSLPEDPARAVLRKPFGAEELQSLARELIRHHPVRRPGGT